MIYGYIIGLRTEITEEEIPVIEDNTKIHFNNISVISWRSVLLEEETGGPDKSLHTIYIVTLD
jgi:hypothetical protein